MKKYVMILCLLNFSILVAYSQQNKAQLLQTMLNDIQPDSLMQTVLELQAQGTRFCFNPHTNRGVAFYLKDRYEQLGITHTEIDSFYMADFEYWMYPNLFSGWQYNFSATILGETQPEKICIIGAHLDDISYQIKERLDGKVYILDSVSPGADDNATGIAIALEIARLFKKYDFRPNKTLRFMAFDAEEVGLLGSNYAAGKSETLQEQIVFFLNNDMVGNNALHKPDWKIKLLPYENAPDVLSFASQVCVQYTTLTPVIETMNSSSSDSYSYYEKGFKSIFVHEYDFSPVYHSLSDSLSYIDPEYLAEATKLSLAMLFLESTGDMLHISTALQPKIFSASVYPNPTHLGSTVSISIPVSQKIQIQLLSAQGGMVFNQEEFKETGTHIFPLPIQHLPAGIYVCKIQTAFSGSKILKLVIRK